MKTILSSVTDEKAIKEVKLFAFLGLAIAFISLFAAWWISIAGIAFSARSLLLTWHRAVSADKVKFRVISTLGLVVGLFCVAVGSTS